MRLVNITFDGDRKLWQSQYRQYSDALCNYVCSSSTAYDLSLPRQKTPLLAAIQGLFICTLNVNAVHVMNNMGVNFPPVIATNPRGLVGKPIAYACPVLSCTDWSYYIQIKGDHLVE